jgi:transposase-like protein
LPLIALIYADQEVLFCFLNQRQSARSAAKYLLASFLRHQGKEKEFFAADCADLRRSREFYFFHQRQSARSAAKYLLPSFFKYQRQRKRFFWPLIALICADKRVFFFHQRQPRVLSHVAFSKTSWEVQPA